MITVDELAEFIWCAEYDCEDYPWKDQEYEAKTYYLDCAKSLLTSFEIKRKSSSEEKVGFIRYDFNARNTPKTLIHIKVEEGITKVFVPGASDTIIVPEGTGLDISVEYRGSMASDAVGRLEVIRNPAPGEVQ